MHQMLIICFVLVFFSAIQAYPRFLASTYTNRIIGGTDGSIYEFPYQASIQVYKEHSCGGAIITPWHVLTAAHCVENLKNSDITILTGTRWSRSGQIHNVARMWIHSQYNSHTLDYDIALIKVSSSLYTIFSTLVRNIQLPTFNEAVPKNDVGIVSGWGFVKEDGHIVDTLKYIRVPFIGRKKCETLYEGLANITTRMICAGFENGGKDSCQGDSGGPLVSKGKLYGIVSWGFGCARPMYPGVYTRVSKFINWINTKVGL